MKHIALELVVVCFILAGLAAWQRLSASRRAIFTAGMLVLLPLLAINVVKSVAPHFHNPPIWDVRCFWVWGRVALGSHNIYDPAGSLAIGSAFPFDANWQRDFLEVGFIYPPQTILLFAPLGLFSTPDSAGPPWYSVNLVAMLAAIYVLWRAFLLRYGAVGLLATTLLVMGFEPDLQTLSNGQPVLILLLLVALYLADGPPVRRGIWLGLAIIVKPLAIALLIQPLVARVAVASAVGAAFLGAVLLVGWNNILPYFTNGPSHRYPTSIWLESENQSLFSAVLRILHQPAPDTLLHAYAFLACALVVTMTSLLLCAKSAGNDRAGEISLLIALALLIFPPSATYYNPLLLIPVLTLWNRYSLRSPLPTITYLAALYGFLVYSTPESPHGTILAPLSIWLIFAWIMMSERAQRAAAVDYLPA
jgi:hypothetical protein